MNRPIEIRNIENISLETSDDYSYMYPQLVAQFTCQYEVDCNAYIQIISGMYNAITYTVCCSVIWMMNVTHAGIEGISVTTKIPTVSAVILQQCSYLHLLSITLISGIQERDNDFDSTDYGFGIVAYESDVIEMDSLEVSYFTNGVTLYSSSNVNMTNVSAAHNHCDGIDLKFCTATNMMNVSSVDNKVYGIYLYFCTNTTMMNISAVHNRWEAIYLSHSTDTSMTNTSANNNSVVGIYFNWCTGLSVTNVCAINNTLWGITLRECTTTSMMNISAVHNDIGIQLDHCNDASMRNVFAVNNTKNGIRLCRTINTSMTNVSATHNQRIGIDMFGCTNTSLYLIHTHHNEEGVYITNSTTTHLYHVHSNGNKIYIVQSAETHILKSNEFSNIEIINTINIYITNTTSLITAINTVNIFLYDSLFCNMAVPSTASSTLDPINLPAVITLYSSTLTITDCTFTRNKISSIKMISSNITICGKVLFKNNIAYLGTALIFAKNSLLIPSGNSNIRFESNYAINYGGVFYITTEESLEISKSLQGIIQMNEESSLITSSTKCFVHIGGSRSHARLTFINNTAGKGGDVLYGGLVALGYDEDWNCLLSFKNISDMSEQSGLSLISSAPSRVCLCSETGQPDCLTVADPTTHFIYPGQTITIPAVMIGQDFGTTTGSIFAQFLHTTNTTDSVDIERRQYSIEIGQTQCSNLEYSVFSQSENFEAVLVLTQDHREISHLMNEEDNQEITNTWEILNKEPNYKTLAQDIICHSIDFFNQEFTIESNQYGNRTINNFYRFTPAHIIEGHYCNKAYQNILPPKFRFPKEIYGYPVYINISFRPCPLGFALSRDPPFRCDCNQLMQHLPEVKCHIQDQTILRSGQIWINTDGNQTVAASNCPYNYCKREEINITFEDPDSQCNFNHTGTLCGGCQPGLSLALGTNQCLQCSNNHLALLLPFTLAGVVLLCLIKGLDLTMSQGTLNGLMFYANVVKANEHLLFENKTNPLSVFFSWLNLDLGIETCFFNGLTAYGKTWLQFVFPLYIWSIAGLIIILAKCSNKVAKVMGDNSVPVLATLFLLSYAKVLRTIITVLSFTMLSTTHGSKAVWSADGNLDYLGPEHAPLFAVAVATLLFLLLPYTLLFFLRQWLHRCNCHLITCITMKIKPFLHAHYSPLKGYHRYWFGALLLVRALILLMSALIPVNHSIITVYTIMVCSLVLTGFAAGVYRSFTVATFNVLWFVNLGLLSATHMFITSKGGNLFLAVNCLFGVGFAQFIGLIVFKVLVIIKRSERVMACLHWEQIEEDDWELYEQAALQREMESDSEGEDTDESGSIESVLTYGY